jgi:hypothetical protein
LSISPSFYIKSGSIILGFDGTHSFFPLGMFDWKKYSRAGAISSPVWNHALDEIVFPQQE